MNDYDQTRYNQISQILKHTSLTLQNLGGAPANGLSTTLQGDSGSSVLINLLMRAPDSSIVLGAPFADLKEATECGDWKSAQYLQSFVQGMCYMPAFLLSWILMRIAVSLGVLMLP